MEECVCIETYRKDGIPGIASVALRLQRGRILLFFLVSHEVLLDTLKREPKR